MVGLTRRICGPDDRPEELRYERRRSSDAVVPLVVWNVTEAREIACRRCHFGACDWRGGRCSTTASVAS
jgi:MoaA/NifB/PqqE/SkfB family radical SAM enzyme